MPGSGWSVVPKILKMVLARILCGHAELIHSRPVFDTGNGDAGSEVMVRGLLFEVHNDFDLAAAVEMDLDACAARLDLDG